ncbi:MAG TPA: glycosyltransferase family 4 protein, partial [Candidatus Tectomicrobia bacterium]|nr:glycosyltransferase family 4 protein [Candidatus Tectomicrobia bacterium]
WSLHDYVCLLGSRTQGEVLERYWSAHLYVLPCVLGSDGNRDGLPVSIVEALACGLPVVTTPMTGIPEVVRNRYNGLLVPDGDPKALADAIESVIQDAHLYERLRANARASVASTFDLGLTAAALERLFEEERA